MLRSPSVCSERVLIEFGAACLAGHGGDFRHREDNLLGFAAYLVALLKRNARKRADIDGERTLVERRHEAAAEGGVEGKGGEKESGCGDQSRTLVAENERECPAVGSAEDTDGDRISHRLFGLRSAAIAQEIAAEDGGDRQGYYCRSYKGYYEGDAEGDKHAPLDATEEEERQETGDDDERGIEDGETDLARGVVDNFDDGSSLFGREGEILADAVVDIFNIDNGIVDQRSDGYSNAAEGHGVDGDSEPVEDEYGDDDREREGDDRDQGGAEIHQEDEQHDDDKDSALE